MFRDMSHAMGSASRLKVLTFFVRRPGEWGNAESVASTLGVTRTQAHKELTALVRLGVLKTRTVKRAVTYSADERDPFFAPLKWFAAQTLTPDDKDIADAFRGIRGVTLVVTSGLLTNEPKSTLDLLIVSKKPNAKRTEKAVRKVEALSALPLRYALLDATEYKGRREAYDRMLRDVFEYTHRIVLERGG